MKKYENGQLVDMTVLEIQQFEAQQAAAQAQQRQNEFNRVRSERNELLAQSDWTQMPDSPLTSAKKQEWAQYRQQLRDFMETVTDPSTVQFPQKPQ